MDKELLETLPKTYIECVREEIVMLWCLLAMVTSQNVLLTIYKPQSPVAVSDHLNLVSLSSDNQLLFIHCVSHCFSTSGSLSTLS